MAAAALLNIYAQTLDEAIASSSSDDFVQGFNLPGDHHDLLSRTYAQATTLLQSNALAEADLISREHGVDEALERLESVKEQQPLLPDGSRCVWTVPREAKSTVLAEAVAVKQRHAQALRHALQQIDQENSELQRQYAEKIVLLQNASSTIASCMTSFQQTAEACEQWRSECS